MSYNTVASVSNEGSQGGNNYVTLPFSVELAVLDISSQNYYPTLYSVSLGDVVENGDGLAIKNALRTKKYPFVLLGEMVAINKRDKQIQLGTGELVYYHYLIKVSGLKNSYSSSHWEEVIPGIEALKDAIKMKKTLSSCFTPNAQMMNHPIKTILADKDIHIDKNKARLPLKENLGENVLSTRNDIYIVKNKTFQLEV